MVCAQEGWAWSLVMNCKAQHTDLIVSLKMGQRRTKASKILNTIILGFNPLSQLRFCRAQPSSWLALVLAALFSFANSARKVIKDNLRLQGSRATIWKHIFAIFAKWFLGSLIGFGWPVPRGCCPGRCRYSPDGAWGALFPEPLCLRDPQPCSGRGFLTGRRGSLSPWPLQSLLLFFSWGCQQKCQLVAIVMVISEVQFKGFLTRLELLSVDWLE